MQAALVVEALGLHVLRPGAQHAGHRGVGALQPRHQPLGATVALKGVSPQVPAERREEKPKLAGHQPGERDEGGGGTHSSMSESRSEKRSLGRNLMLLLAKDLKTAATGRRSVLFPELPKQQTQRRCKIMNVLRSGTHR